MPGGRPDKLTPEVQSIIVRLMGQGNWMQTAARVAGVDPKTVTNWLRDGAKAKSGKKREFFLAVRRAVAECEAGDMAIVERARQTDWRAATWRLQHRWPQRWTGRIRQEISGPRGAPVQVGVKASVDEMSDDELLRIAQGADKPWPKK